MLCAEGIEVILATKAKYDRVKVEKADTVGVRSYGAGRTNECADKQCYQLTQATKCD